MVVSSQALRAKSNSAFFFFFHPLSPYSRRCQYRSLAPLQRRTIFSTAPLENSWMDKIKGIFTWKKSEAEPQLHTAGPIKPEPRPFTGKKAEKAVPHVPPTPSAFTLSNFADTIQKARKMGSLKDLLMGGASEGTIAAALGKQEKIFRYLGNLDPTGENLRSGQKQEAARQCNCSLAEVDDALAKFSLAKKAEIKLAKLKEEGKPLPKSIAEIQKLVSSDIASTNTTSSGQTSRNAPCPCGSKKKYKKCCGKASKV